MCNIYVKSKKKIIYMFNITIKFRLHAGQPAAKKYFYFFLEKPNADLEVFEGREQLC